MASFTERLRGLGCVKGWEEELDLYLKEHHSAEMFEELYILVSDLMADAKRSLAKEAQ